MKMNYLQHYRNELLCVTGCCNIQNYRNMEKQFVYISAESRPMPKSSFGFWGSDLFIRQWEKYEFT